MFASLDFLFNRMIALAQSMMCVCVCVRGDGGGVGLLTEPTQHSLVLDMGVSQSNRQDKKVSY